MPGNAVLKNVSMSSIHSAAFRSAAAGDCHCRRRIPQGGPVYRVRMYIKIYDVLGLLRVDDVAAQEQPEPYQRCLQQHACLST